MEPAPSAAAGATKQILPILPLSDDDITHKRAGNVLLEGSKTLLSSQRGGKRKRGRPSGSMKRGKSNVSQARRTRAMVVNRLSKIREDKSDETGSSDDRTNEGGETVEQDCGIYGMASKDNSELQETQMVKHKGEVAEEEVAEDQIKEAFINTTVFKTGGSHRQQEWIGEAPDVEMGEKFCDQEIEKPEKLEVMVDPVHAMLVDMIPSLGMKKAEIISPTPDNENPDIMPDSKPVKKKKVSYKDVAGELLKN
uniref:DNA ligase n=1 Tax=Rhizophora mucronata TaxID=61149 RepID=A0A2P2K6Q3_RHIMU